MNFLTSTVLSGIAWDGIRKMGCMTSEYLKQQLKEWLLDEKSYETIADRINNIPEEYRKSKKFLEAAIEEDKQLQDILQSTSSKNTYAQNNSGTFNYSNVVSGNVGNLTINNLNEKKKLKSE
ncbi:hypothetical protein [Priestia sp. FSL R5-0680]|uniref:hypothetical protein n=1 Tax=Priestia sp. FSL R5-0680 TaxID=2921582 RepID=UPI0030F50707